VICWLALSKILDLTCGRIGSSSDGRTKNGVVVRLLRYAGTMSELMLLEIEYIASVAAMEWRVSADKEEEVLKYYNEVVGPTISSSPDVLRFRVFAIDNATIMQGGKYTTKEKDVLHTYFTLVELESEEWPWDVVVDLADTNGWKNYFETQKVVVRPYISSSDLKSANRNVEVAAQSLPDEKGLSRRQQRRSCEIRVWTQQRSEKASQSRGYLTATQIGEDWCG
jgi:hypothetical protein